MKKLILVLCCVLPLSAMAAPSPREIWNYKKGDVTRFLKYDHLTYGVLDETPFAWTMINPTKDCNSGNIDAIREMLDVNPMLADSRRFNPSDGTVLFIPANSCCINRYDTCKNNMAEIAEILLDYGADVNALGNPNHRSQGNRTALEVLREARSAQTCHNTSVCDAIEQMLLARGAMAYNNDTSTQTDNNTNPDTPGTVTQGVNVGDGCLFGSSRCMEAPNIPLDVKVLQSVINQPEFKKKMSYKLMLTSFLNGSYGIPFSIRNLRDYCEYNMKDTTGHYDYDGTCAQFALTYVQELAATHRNK